MITYTYNGQGKRIQKTVNGTTTKYYYGGDELILEKTGPNSIYYIHVPRIDEIISDSRGYCYHYDGLGSVVNLTNASGIKATSYTYKAFGSIRSQSGTVSNTWLFTGRQFDAESGLYFYRNRYYDARVGRFITQDPSLILNPYKRIIPYSLKNNLSLPLKLHKYIYCINNPINKFDPLGLNPWQDIQEVMDAIYNWYESYDQQAQEWYKDFVNPEPVINPEDIYADDILYEILDAISSIPPGTSTGNPELDQLIQTIQMGWELLDEDE